MTVTVAVPDVISPSYFPAIAAVELGLFEERGISAVITPAFPVDVAYDRLRKGELAYVAGAAHAALHAFPNWAGAELVCALSQHMYWFLVARATLNVGVELEGLRGTRIGAAPGPVDGLRWVLSEYGLDPDVDVKIGAIASISEGDSFGVAAAAGLDRGEVDAFWANGMAKEIAVQSGVGIEVVDARRDDHPEGMGSLTFPALVTTSTRREDRPNEVALAREAIIEAQTLLSQDPTLSETAARRLFPDKERGLIAGLIAADSSYYQPEIDPETLAQVNEFARWLGLLSMDSEKDNGLGDDVMVVESIVSDMAEWAGDEG